MAGIATTSPSPTKSARLMANRFSLRWGHIRTLLWLRWKLTLRGYTRSWRQMVGFIFSTLFMLALAVALGFGTSAGYLLLDRPDAAQLLFVVLAALWLAWAAFPLLQYTLNEGLDVTKLQMYPLTRGEQMVSLVLATLLDVSTIIIFALFAAIIIGWHATLTAVVITLVALALAYVLIVTTSQLLLAALMGMLRSRRFRDLTVIFFALFGVSCSLINQFASRALFHFRPGAFVSLHLDTYLQWFPTGMAARAITLADQGDYLAALPWLGMMLVLVPALVTLWAWVLDRGITTAESAGSGPVRRSRRGRPEVAGGTGAGVNTGAAVGARSTRTGWGPISGPALAIADKDRRYFWRDPQIKASLLSSLFILVIVIASRFYGDSGDIGAPGTPTFLVVPFQVLFAPLPALLITLNLSLNAFGLEREGLQTLFLFPVKPLDIFRGKNFAVGVLSIGGAIVLTLLVAALSGGWSNAPLALGYAVAAILVLMGCGNLTSVFAPMRVRRMRVGQGSFSSSENGCLRSLTMMLAFMATFVLLLPVAAALAIPLALSHTEWLVFTLPASVLYAALFYELATRLAASQLLQRAPDILKATVPEN